MPSPSPNLRRRRIPRPASRRPLESPSHRRMPRRGARGSLRRTVSMPELPTPLIDGDGGDGSGTFIRFLTCSDVCSPASPSPPPAEGAYLDNLKVQMNVVVEESPGPVKVLIKLNATVAEMIQAVVRQYSKEGRSPPLGPATLASFRLYHSYFSLEGLDEAKMLRDVGGRNFYLRKKACPWTRSTLKDAFERSGLETSDSSSVPSLVGACMVVSSFIVRSLRKIGRRTRKFWQILGCLACG